MPANYIDAFAKESGKDKKTVEKYYEQAKKIVEKGYNKTEKDGESFYQLVTGVLKKMLSISTSDALCGCCAEGVSLTDSFCLACGSELIADASQSEIFSMVLSALRPLTKGMSLSVEMSSSDSVMVEFAPQAANIKLGKPQDSDYFLRCVLVPAANDKYSMKIVKLGSSLLNFTKTIVQYTGPLEGTIVALGKAVTFIIGESKRRA